MKLVHSEYSLVLEFKENEVQVLTVENPLVYTALLSDLYRQSEGAEGGWFLSEHIRELSIAKKVEVILSPLSLDVNNRKILGKLYQELKSVSDDEFYGEVQEINHYLVRYLDNLCLKLPYPIQFMSEMDLLGLFKLYDLKIEMNSSTLAENLSQYVQLLGELCGISLIVFVNLKSYLTDFELLELYKAAFYCKMNLLLLEPVQRTVLEGEHNVVIDKQKCMIEF